MQGFSSNFHFCHFHYELRLQFKGLVTTLSCKNNAKIKKKYIQSYKTK